MTLVWIVSYDTDLKTSVRLRSLGSLGGSGSGFMIQDYTDHGVPKERDFVSFDQLP